MIDSGEVKAADEIEDDFDLLNTLAGGIICLVDDDLFHEFVYHGGRQFFDSSSTVSVKLVHDSIKLGGGFFLLTDVFDRRGDFFLQRDLFLLVLCRHFLIALEGEHSLCVVLIGAHQQIVDASGICRNALLFMMLHIKELLLCFDFSAQFFLRWKIQFVFGCK